MQGVRCSQGLSGGTAHACVPEAEGKRAALESFPSTHMVSSLCAGGGEGESPSHEDHETPDTARGRAQMGSCVTHLTLSESLDDPREEKRVAIQKLGKAAE